MPIPASHLTKGKTRIVLCGAVPPLYWVLACEADDPLHFLDLQGLSVRGYSQGVPLCALHRDG